MNVNKITENIEEFTGNVYLINNEHLVDTGTNQQTLNQLEKIDNVKTITITHTHYDHINHLQYLIDEHEPKIYCYNKDKLNITNYETVLELEDRQKYSLDGTNFKVFHTPGHKNDHLCIYQERKRVLFTGDLIMPDGGFGRTDLEEGNREKLIESIRKITELDVKRMFPGHGEVTSSNVNKQIKNSLKNAEKRESKY